MGSRHIEESNQLTSFGSWSSSVVMCVSSSGKLGHSTGDIKTKTI